MSSNPLKTPETSMTLPTMMIQPNRSQMQQLKEHVIQIATFEIETSKDSAHWEKREIGVSLSDGTFGFGCYPQEKQIKKIEKNVTIRKGKKDCNTFLSKFKKKKKITSFLGENFKNEIFFLS